MVVPNGRKKVDWLKDRILFDEPFNKMRFFFAICNSFKYQSKLWLPYEAYTRVDVMASSASVRVIKKILNCNRLKFICKLDQNCLDQNRLRKHFFLVVGVTHQNALTYYISKQHLKHALIRSSIYLKKPEQSEKRKLKHEHKNTDTLSKPP